ncbi:WD40-repeat-containing domain protein [Xylaria grammica]|nr:WD40-repeat-containing domain protein [Xylaria grammica]
MASGGDLKSQLKKPIKKLLRRYRSPSGTPPIADDQSVEQDSAHDASEVSSIAAASSHADPLSSVADTQIIRPSVGALPADQHHSVAALQVPCLVIPVEPLREPAPASPIATSEPTSLSQELWNAAYSALEVEEAELVEIYVKTLREVLGGETGEADATDTLKEMEDPKRRQEYMGELVRKGQERIKRASRVATKVGSFADFVLSSKGIVDLTLKAVPQAAPAALPWAGVCLGLEILRNPAQEMNSNLEGIAYVISRMDWYCALTKLVLNRNVADSDVYQEVVSQLKTNIIQLYKALLLYQIKSIISYYRNRFGHFFRHLVKLDDWEGSIQHAKDIENAVRADIDQYYQGHTKTSLDKLSHNADKQTTLLGNIRQDIHTFISQEKAASRDKDEADCRRDLFVVNPQHDMKRIENNKDDLLDSAYEWIFDTPEYEMFSSWDSDGLESPQPQILWLKGRAGTGKTMLMIGLIRRLSSRSAALAPWVSYFFCQGTDSKLRNATAVLRSLIWLLLLQQRHLISHLLREYKDSGASLFTDQNSFFALSEVFKNMLKDDKLLPVYFAIDALDECLEGREQLIALISDTLTLSKEVKWLLSSRPEVEVPPELRPATSFVEINTKSLKHPVKAYIKYKLDTLRERVGYDNEVLDELSEIVQERAGNTFLWVALAFKTLGKRNGGYAIEIMSEMPAGLSELYEHMIDRIARCEKSMPSDCKKVLKAAFLAFRPLSFSELSVVTGLRIDITEDAVEECGSFFAVSDEIANFIHQSAKDFLKDVYNPKQDSDWAALGHPDFVQRSLSVISVSHREDYKLEPGTEAKDIIRPDPDPLAKLQYFYVSWIGHIMLCLNNEQRCILRDLMAEVLKFLQQGFLSWLESLSILGEVSDGLLSLNELVQIVEARPDMDPGLVEFLKDAYMFFSRNSSIIHQAPLQVYGGALVFSPTMSKVRHQYWDKRVPFVERKLYFKDHWDDHQTIYEHRSVSRSIAFLPDKTLASALLDGTVQFYDAATGAHRQTLDLQERRIDSMAVSRGGESLAIGLWRKVQLWDVATRVCRRTFEGHTSWVRAVAFSPDDTTLASASEDKTVRLWHLAGDMRYQTLEGHTGAVAAVAFSPNSQTLVSGSEDGTVRLWDAATGELQKTIESRMERVYAVAFSPDNKTLAVGGRMLIDYGPVSLWDVATGAHIHSLEQNSRAITAVAFSPDGGMLASASDDRAVRLWAITSTTSEFYRKPVGGLKEVHTAPAVSPVRTFKGHTGGIVAVAFSPNGKTLASASNDGTVRIWDITPAWPSRDRPKERSDPVIAVALSPNGKSLVSLLESGLLELWDLATTQPNCTVEEYPFDVSDWAKVRGMTLAHSLRGIMIAFNLGDRIYLLDKTTHLLKRKILKIRNVRDVMLSPDSKMLAFISDYCKLWLWDLTTKPPKGRVLLSYDVKEIEFLPDSKMPASISVGGTPKLWDLTAVSASLEGRLLLQEWHLDTMVFSPNSRILKTASKDGTNVQNWDVATGLRLPSHDWPLRDHRQNETPEYGISNDHCWITSNGKNLLLIPGEYRQISRRSFAIQGSIVALVRDKGGLVVMEF